MEHNRKGERTKWEEGEITEGISSLAGPYTRLGHGGGVRRSHRLLDPDGCQLHDPAVLNLAPLLSKVSLGIKRPVETTYNPVRQSLDVNLNLCIDFWAPRWKASPVLGEAVDGFLTEVSDEVYGFLEGNSVVTHHDHDHVVCVAFGLFAVVREDILEKVGSEDQERE